MDAFEKIENFDNEVDEGKTFIIPNVIFWPKRWIVPSNLNEIIWHWEAVPFKPENAELVPNDTHGVYSFVIDSKIFNHPKNSLILYLGKAQDMTLRERFISYFDEMKKKKRPHISYYLRKFNGFLDFHFQRIEVHDKIQFVEESLLAAFMPPCNRAFPAEVSEIVRGLR